MKIFAVNQVYKTTLDDKIERVLWLHPEDGGFFAIDIKDPKALPVYRSGAYLRQLERDGAIDATVADPWANIWPAEDSIPLKHRLMRDKNWSLLRPIILDQPAIFTEAGRGKWVTILVKAKSLTHRTIYRLLRRYWERGLSPNALLPDYINCGGPGKVRKETSKKRGRPSRAVPGVNVSAAMRVIIKQTITREFARNPAMTLQDAYTNMLRRYFSNSVVDLETGRQKLDINEEAPSFGQFLYWYRKESDVFTVRRKRVSARRYDKDMRAILGSSTAQANGPGSRYQIDATIADIYLVSRYDRSKIIGRPVLYVVIDVFSRMIVGIHIGLEGPSWVGAMEAISNAACSKVAYCKKFGIDIAEEDWPSVGLPDVLTADRGEVLSDNADALALNFGVRIENTPPYRADWKGVVEQRFKLIAAKFKAYTPGYVQPDYQERGGADYRLDATLDIDDFTRAIIAIVRYYNTSHPIKDYEKSSDMIAGKVKPVPVDLWEWGISNRSGKLRHYPERVIRQTLLPSDDARVTPMGIKFQGLYYSCSLAIEEHWFARARQNSTWKVRVSYDPRDMDHIYLHHAKVGSKFVDCTLTEKSRHHAGRTLWEIDQVHQENRLQRRQMEPARLRAEINVIDTVKSIVAEAEAKKPDTRGLSKAARTSSIRENRAEERRGLMRRDAFRPVSGEHFEATVVPFPCQQPDDDYSMPEVCDYMPGLAVGEGNDDV
jgi:hypothetical protein